MLDISDIIGELPLRQDMILLIFTSMVFGRKVGQDSIRGLIMRQLLLLDLIRFNGLIIKIAL